METPAWLVLEPKALAHEAKRRCTGPEDLDFLLQMNGLSLGRDTGFGGMPTLPSFLLPDCSARENWYDRVSRILSVSLSNSCDQRQSSWIVEKVRQILSDASSERTIRIPPRRIGGTPLHQAVRNHGKNAEILRLLLNFDERLPSRMLTTRDDVGDLPLHLACRSGMPVENLEIVLECMAKENTQSVTELVWSYNSEGFTPIDLAWIHYLEADMVLPRLATNPGHVRGEADRRAYQVYFDLLTDMVNGVIDKDPSTIGFTMSPILKVAALIARTVGGRAIDGPAMDVHALVRLQCPVGAPAVPLPIMKLVLAAFPNESGQTDHEGKLPLHYACMIGEKVLPHGQDKTWWHWRSLVEELVHIHPEACAHRDASGRLPIHYLLDRKNFGTKEGESDFNFLLNNLLTSCPFSVETEDPNSGLLPCIMAAANPSVTLDIVYTALRLFPHAVSS